MSHVNLMDAAGQRMSIFANPGSNLHEVELETVRPLARRILVRIPTPMEVSSALAIATAAKCRLFDGPSVATSSVANICDTYL